MSVKSYAEAIAEKYKDQEVEIYIGDDTGTVLYADHDVAQKSVIRGTVRTATGDFLTIDVIFKSSMETSVVNVDINAWCIKGVMRKQSNGISIMNVFGNQEVRRMKR